MKLAHLPSAVQLAADQVKKKTFQVSEVIADPVQRKAPRNEVRRTKDEGPGTRDAPHKTSKLPSIKALKNLVSVDSISQSSPEVSKPKRADAFKKKELFRYWKEFTEDRRKEGKQQQFLILSQDPVMVDELTIQIKVNSSVQIDTVDQLKSDLLPFLRDKLQNDGLKLEAELEMDESKPLIYTPAEKFKYLAEKHPTLKVLQEKLGLDPDF